MNSFFLNSNLLFTIGIFPPIFPNLASNEPWTLSKLKAENRLIKFEKIKIYRVVNNLYLVDI
jgi:hypothetical protein